MLAFVGHVAGLRVASLAPASVSSNRLKPYRISRSARQTVVCSGADSSDDAETEGYVRRYIEEEVKRRLAEEMASSQAAEPVSQAPSTSPNPTDGQSAAAEPQQRLSPDEMLPGMTFDDSDVDYSDYGRGVRKDDMQGTVWRKKDGSFEIGMKVPLPQDKLKAIEDSKSFEEAIRIMNEEISLHRDRRRSLSQDLTGPQAASDYFDLLSKNTARGIRGLPDTSVLDEPQDAPRARSLKPRQQKRYQREASARRSEAPPPVTSFSPPGPVASVARQLIDAEIVRYNFKVDKLHAEHRARIAEIMDEV